MKEVKNSPFLLLAVAIGTVLAIRKSVSPVRPGMIKLSAIIKSITATKSALGDRLDVLTIWKPDSRQGSSVIPWYYFVDISTRKDGTVIDRNTSAWFSSTLEETRKSSFSLVQQKYLPGVYTVVVRVLAASVHPDGTPDYTSPILANSGNTSFTVTGPAVHQFPDDPWPETPDYHPRVWLTGERNDFQNTDLAWYISGIYPNYSYAWMRNGTIGRFLYYGARFEFDENFNVIEQIFGPYMKLEKRMPAAIVENDPTPLYRPLTQLNGNRMISERDFASDALRVLHPFPVL